MRRKAVKKEKKVVRKQDEMSQTGLNKASLGRQIFQIQISQKCCTKTSSNKNLLPDRLGQGELGSTPPLPATGMLRN